MTDNMLAVDVQKCTQKLIMEWTVYAEHTNSQTITSRPTAR